jgi:hypothetical protein
MTAPWLTHFAIASHERLAGMTGDVIYAGMSCHVKLLLFSLPLTFRVRIDNTLPLRASMQSVWPSTQKGWRPFERARGEHALIIVPVIYPLHPGHFGLRFLDLKRVHTSSCTASPAGVLPVIQ